MCDGLLLWQTIIITMKESILTIVAAASIAASPLEADGFELTLCTTPLMSAPPADRQQSRAARDISIKSLFRGCLCLILHIPVRYYIGIHSRCKLQKLSDMTSRFRY